MACFLREGMPASAFAECLGSVIHCDGPLHVPNFFAYSGALITAAKTVEKV